MISQLNILKEIQSIGYNVVTCGNCGGVVLHKIINNIETIECTHCNTTMDLCDMPDLYY